MSNLRQRLSAAADRVFATFDTGGDNSAIKQAVYHRMTAPAYDPTTGTVSPGTVDSPCNGYYQDWTQNQINGTTVKVGDRKFGVRGDRLGFEPSADDSITIAGQLWSIKDYSADPAGIIFLLHIRATQ